MMRLKQKEYRKLAEVWYMTAHEALWRNSAAEHDAGIDYETPEYLALNHEANEAAARVPWWRQAVLGLRLRARLIAQGVRI